MCFSAEASFAGAAGLAIIGAMTVKAGPKENTHLWLLIPFLFAFQQFCEGIVWLDLRGDIDHSPLTVFAKNLYLFMALCFWPVWVPFCFTLVEKSPIRKGILLALIPLGIYVAFNGFFVYHLPSIRPDVHGHSIQYPYQAIYSVSVLYLLVVVLAPILSSLRYMWIFGLAVFGTSIIADYMYTQVFTSVWCFMGAISSFSLYYIARANGDEKAKELVK